MLGPVLSYALSICATAGIALLGFMAFSYHRRQAHSLWEREQRLPDATRFENLKLQIEEKQAEYEVLRDQLYDARDVLDEAQRQRQWMESAREEIAKLEQDRQEVVRVQNELETRQGELAETHNKLQELNSAIEGQERALRDLKSEQETIAREVESLRSEKKDADRLREELKRLVQEKETLEASVRAIEQQGRQIEDELARRKTRLSELNKRIDELKSDRRQLQEQTHDLEKQVGKLKSEAASLSAQIPTLQTAFDSLSSAIQKAAPDGDSDNSEIWRPVLGQGHLSRGDTEELECLQRVENHLVHAGLRFDQRTIFAFHTALKTTDSSPLVTLAGVSGTGKSELPRRYADAMGLNFLNVAVQPRWDSPHDLFGFYDYLEQRFRSTELTRALLQMDPIGPSPSRGWKVPDDYQNHRCADQLLLVLLDEMNLARVEYYFSEFLSKLETRRGVNVADEVQRTRAEILLEVAGRRSGELPLRLFVGRNVLFVGTMNEDESTLALSDKVIDRSNVLRFGSPASIERLSRNGKSPSGEPSGKLPYSIWKEWHRTSIPDDDRERLLSWLNRLQKSLEAVGRPFAFRVANAVQEYVANYPEVDNRLEWAMSDQIEQKILPKLIGLDTHQHAGVVDAINTISSILAEIGDDKLRERLETSRQEDYFQWTGLDRTVPQ